MISRWEKAAKKMVKVERAMRVDKKLGCSSIQQWRVAFPSCLSVGGESYAYFDVRALAREFAQRRIQSLTAILQRASKEAGF